MPVVVLAGEEDFLLYRRLKVLKDELVDPSWVAFNFCRLVSPELSDVVDAAATLPFGPGKRMVLIDRCELFTKRKVKGGESAAAASEKAMKELLDRFDQALGAVVPETYLVFACLHNLDSTLRTTKVLMKHVGDGDIERFERLDPLNYRQKSDFVTFCNKEAHKRDGATISDDAATYLVESTEGSLRQIASEIEKAATYLLPAKHIDIVTVERLSSHHSHIFSLLDHWAQGNTQMALTDLEELLSTNNGIQIIATLHTFLSKWLSMKALAERETLKVSGGPGVQRREVSEKFLASTIAPALKLRPERVEWDLKRIRKLSVERLAEKKRQLTALEHLVKTGQMPDQHALTIFLAS